MARAGRKRKFHVERQKSGRPKLHDNPRQTVVEARIRLFNLSKDDAQSELAGYALGRMALAGSLGNDYRPILDAADGYVSATARYMRVKYPTWPLPKAMDFISAKGLGGEPQIDEVERIISRYEAYRTILSAVDGLSRGRFHQIAFHDLLANPPLDAIAVRKCTQAIIKGLQNKRK